MLDLQKLIDDSTAALIEVDARISTPGEPNVALLNGIRTGLEMAVEAGEALQRKETPPED